MICTVITKLNYNCMWQNLGNKDAVIIVGAKRCVALGTFPKTSVVASLEAVVAKHVETFAQNCVLPVQLTAWTLKNFLY